jgi:hypothetical protein
LENDEPQPDGDQYTPADGDCHADRDGNPDPEANLVRVVPAE